MPTTTLFRFCSKNIHEPAMAADGVRVLVERSWPRGLAREDAHIDLWLADAAPSAELLQWFGGDTTNWDDFRHRYRAELDANGPVLRQLRQFSQGRPVTLLYSDGDTTRNHAEALAEYLRG
jgi:uncharacterized protein YeaO (DUF488 family)